MRADSRLWAVLALAAAALLAVLAAVAGWWALLWAAVPLGLGGLLVLLRAAGVLGSPETGASAPDFDEPYEADPIGRPVADEPPAPRRTHLAKSPLASSHPEYDVLLSAVVCWRAEFADDPGYAGRAATLILERAAALTAATAPQDCETTRHRLAAELGREVRAEPERIAIWAEEVRLELHDDDAARLQRIRDFRKDEEIRGYERAADRSYRHYLRDDMLADPGQAVLWWLARDPDRIHDTVNEIGTLSRLSAAANGAEIPSLYRDLAGETDGTGSAPPSGTPRDAETGTPDTPLPGFPDLLFGAGADGLDGGAEKGAGRFSEHSGGTGETGEDVRQTARRLADLLAGADGDGSRDRVEVVADMLMEAGQAEIARLLRNDRRTAAKPPTGTEASADSAGGWQGAADGAEPYRYGPQSRAHERADAADPVVPHTPNAPDDAAGPTASGPWFADEEADADGSVSSRGSARAGHTDGTSPGHGNGAEPGTDGARLRG